jgi:HNH endonuclease
VKRSPLKLGKPMQRKPFKRKAATSRTGTSTTKAPRYTGPTKKMRDAVLLRDDYTCQRCRRDIRNQPYSLQHLLPRGRGGKNTMRNLVTVCGSATTPGRCHDWMENQERRLATRDGWLVPNGINPDDWPVLRFGQQYETPGDEWTPATPHPMQIEMGAAA